jgi:luciferase family oxidoreductase group 1
MKQLPYSILELAVVSEGSTAAETFRNNLRLAQEAEALGYTRFWLAEHHNMISVASAATVVLIGHIAQGTKTLRVGSGGIMLPNHSPLIVAEQFGTLGSLYPGRIDLGLGRAPGTDQVTAHAIRPERMQSVYGFPQEISQIQQYFSPNNSSAKVRVYIAEGVNVPLYILGSSTESARLAAAKGLPYAFASHFSSGALMEALKIYRDEFQPSSHLSEPYTIACVNVIAAESDEKAEMLSTSYLRMVLGIFSGQLTRLQPPVEMSAELREIAQAPAFQSFLKYAFIGDKETVRKGLEEFVQTTGVSELMIATSVYDPAERLASYRRVAEIMQEG